MKKLLFVVFVLTFSFATMFAQEKEIPKNITVDFSRTNQALKMTGVSLLVSAGGFTIAEIVKYNASELNDIDKIKNANNTAMIFSLVGAAGLLNAGIQLFKAAKYYEQDKKKLRMDINGIGVSLSYKF